ncbi:MAG TPA: hypothetical protein VLG44_01100 [Chlamydiales bacterium]|nr:hypothetical protein [Chlamydiales bacterium]
MTINILDKVGAVDNNTTTNSVPPPAPAGKFPFHKAMLASALKSLEQAINEDTAKIKKANEEFKKSVNGG